MSAHIISQPQDGLGCGPGWVGVLSKLLRQQIPRDVEDRAANLLGSTGSPVCNIFGFNEAWPLQRCFKCPVERGGTHKYRGADTNLTGHLCGMSRHMKMASAWQCSVPSVPGGQPGCILFPIGGLPAPTAQCWPSGRWPLPGSCCPAVCNLLASGH